VAAESEKPTAQTRTISIRGFKFFPNTLTVNVGDTIEWKNADIVPHTVTAVDKSFSSGDIAPGDTWRFVAKKAGSFPYACTPHPNMKARLIVQ
jgi:plastocyanin